MSDHAQMLLLPLEKVRHSVCSQRTPILILIILFDYLRENLTSIRVSDVKLGHKISHWGANLWVFNSLL